MLRRNKHTTLPKYDSPLTMASVIGNIQAEFPLFEANLPSDSFFPMNSVNVLSMCDVLNPM